MKQEPKWSKSAKLGNKVYFVDVRETKNGKPYLSVSTTDKFNREDKRTTLYIWDNPEQLITVLAEGATHLTK
ncbi:MAG: DUF3276 family protein [Proteobacteria bacterium]|nr:DUF3276 family protein [Pseudomonadota bacterium]